MNIIYEDMPSRVTEKIVKGDVLILKHTPCKIVGWDLHTIDRIKMQGIERHLTRMPTCIHLEFADVEWTIDEQLGRGVFPLHPVQRSWELNESTGAKVKRTGYALLPDFAWTAFMAQGMTLRSGLADCGDVLDAAGLTEQMNTYVILSRLTTAEGLLLLRAFAPQLFSNGEPPGPRCLLKYLRSRFCGHTANYSVEDARAEYADRMANYTVRKERLKAQGPTWPCFECEHKLPSERFGAPHTDADKVYENCVAPGHWRRCETCRESWEKRGHEQLGERFASRVSKLGQHASSSIRR